MASGKQLYQAILRATRQAQEAQEYKALPKPEDRTDPQNLLERLLGIKEAGGEQLDLPLQQPESGSTKKLTPLQEADRRDARLAEIEEASDEIGESLTGKAKEDINAAFDRLMRERNVSADELQPLPESIKKPPEKQKTKWDEKKKDWRTPTKKELEKEPKAVTKKSKKIEEEYTELDRPQVFRDPEQQEQVIRQYGGAKGVFEDPIDEIRLDDLMRRQGYLDRQAGIPVETPTKGTPVPQSDKINYNPKTGRIKGTPRPARKYHAELDTPSTFRAAGTGGRSGTLPTRATTKTGELESQGVGASRSSSDPIQQQHISAQELTMDSPQAQGQMLDLFGDEHEFMMQRVRDILKQMPPEVRQTLPQQVAAGRGAPTNLRAIIKEVADAKTVDELAGTIHGRGLRGVDEGPGDIPVSIDNLRATIASAPDSPEKTAALKKLNKFSAEVSRKSVGRQTKQVPTVHPNRPKPDPRLLEELIDRLNKPINPQDKAETRLGELRNLYRTARGDFPPKDPSKVVRRNTDPSGRLKAIQSAGENVAPSLSQSMIDMLQELLGQ